MDSLIPSLRSAQDKDFQSNSRETIASLQSVGLVPKLAPIPSSQLSFNQLNTLLNATGNLITHEKLET
ncbi:MAG: hypothetical protein K6E76_06050 [Patescibacteria group bacterium]|nr:hypothetical protein [Patescibacteria group bacterium]